MSSIVFTSVETEVESSDVRITTNISKIILTQDVYSS